MALKLAPVKSSPDLPCQSHSGHHRRRYRRNFRSAHAGRARASPWVVLEKGQVGGRAVVAQSGLDPQNPQRTPSDIPLALAADQLWSQMAQRTGVDVGYRQNGIMFVSDADKDMEMYSSWFKAASEISPQSRLITPDEIDQLAPGCQRKWKGGLYTPTDGYAEPTLANQCSRQCSH